MTKIASNISQLIKPSITEKLVSGSFSLREMATEPETYDYMGQADPSPGVGYEEFPDYDDTSVSMEAQSDVPPF